MSLVLISIYRHFFFFFQAEDGIRDHCVTGVQTCALPIFARDGGAAVVLEHGDFVTGNLVVGEDGEVVALDAAGDWAIPGRDTTMLVLDLFALRAGAKGPDVDVGLRAFARAVFAGDPVARRAGDLLDDEIGLRDAGRRASRLVLLAVLRH